jgi:hypothetical protein
VGPTAVRKISHPPKFDPRSLYRIIFLSSGDRLYLRRNGTGQEYCTLRRIGVCTSCSSSGVCEKPVLVGQVVKRPTQVIHTQFLVGKSVPKKFLED